MADEVGIVMKLYDEVSPALKSIAGNTRAFDKSVDELEAKIKEYDKAQTTLTGRMSSLKKELAENSVKVKEAQRAYKKLKARPARGRWTTPSTSRPGCAGRWRRQGPSSTPTPRPTRTSTRRSPRRPPPRAG